MRNRSLFTIICTALFALIVLLLHALSPDYSPVRQFVSEYGYGTFGWLASIAFIIMGAGWIALGLSLAQMDKETRSSIGLILLYAGAAAQIIFGFFPMQPAIPPTTLAGTIHYFTGLLFFIIGGLFPLLITLKLRKSPVFQPIAKPLLALSIINLVWDALGFLIQGMGLAGLTQRIFILLWVSWTLWVSNRLMRSA